MGYEVDYVCDAPSNSNISKAIGRINKRFIRGTTERYFKQRVLPFIKGKKYENVLIIGGMTFAFSSEMIKEIKKQNPQAKFIMYQWDSEENLPYSSEIHPYIDQLYSFDLNDCENKSKYQFLPLFYTRIYEQIGAKNSINYEYDCSYVGTAHPQKFKDINMMSRVLREKLPNQFIYHYMPSKLKYFYHKLQSPEFRKAKFKDFQTKKLQSGELFEIFEKSKCILDAPQAGQSGLTMRTIECLGAKRKLITTNKDIKKYDFYNEANIFVFDDVIDIDRNCDFFTSPFIEIDDEVYIKYSLREWLYFMLKKGK